MSRLKTSRVFRSQWGAPLLVSIAVAAACSTPAPTNNRTPSGTGAPPAAPPSGVSGFTPLTRSIHPLAKPQFDVGHRDPSIPTPNAR